MNKIIDREAYEKYIEEKYQIRKAKYISDKNYKFTDKDLDEIMKIHREKRKALFKSWKLKYK